MKQAQESNHPPARLLAIVEVDHDQRVRCGNPGCGHSVYKAIHVVQDGQELLVLGSTCFNKRYGVGVLGGPQYGGGSGRRLTTDQRDLLLSNTQALLEQFKAEDEAIRQEQLRARPPFSERMPPIQSAQLMAFRPSVSHPAKQRTPPWPWMRPGTSVAGFKLRDGSCWVRVQHKDGMQMLTPWPVFDGWDEWLPVHLGHPDVEMNAYRVSDIQAVVAFLRDRLVAEKISGVWAEVAAVLSPG